MTVATMEAQNTTTNTYGSIVPATCVQTGDHIVFRTLDGRKSGLVTEANALAGRIHIQFIGKNGRDYVVLRPESVVGVLN